MCGTPHLSRMTSTFAVRPGMTRSPLICESDDRASVAIRSSDCAAISRQMAASTSTAAAGPTNRGCLSIRALSKIEVQDQPDDHVDGLAAASARNEQPLPGGPNRFLIQAIGPVERFQHFHVAHGAVGEHFHFQ